MRFGDQFILTDVGDGAAEQLSKVGIGLEQIQTVLISHLHFDHTGGLFAVLSLRFQTSVPGQLTIYGPPGTSEMVSKLLAAMDPGILGVQTMRLPGGTKPPVKVFELKDGSAISVGGIRIEAAENSHYDTLGPPSSSRPISLSYRFNVPDRAIVYTGDTGPSTKVTELCKGANLLVSEIMDPALAIARLKVLRPNVPPALIEIVEDHFRREHLAPEEVGKLAKACGVKTVILTHNSLERNELTGAQQKIAAHFKGDIIFADDLASF